LFFNHVKQYQALTPEGCLRPHHFMREENERQKRKSKSTESTRRV
jgi:hypothetical protein